MEPWSWLTQFWNRLIRIHLTMIFLERMFYVIHLGTGVENEARWLCGPFLFPSYLVKWDLTFSEGTSWNIHINEANFHIKQKNPIPGFPPLILSFQSQCLPRNLFTIFLLLLWKLISLKSRFYLLCQPCSSWALTVRCWAGPPGPVT